jgi:hypothetical protein
MKPTEVLEYKGYKISVYPDENPENPRHEDNLGTMVCFHRKYNLGDKHKLSHGDFDSWDGIDFYLRKRFQAAIILPLYLMDHSGISMGVRDFGDAWDSGQVGFIYVTKERIREWFSQSRVSAKLLLAAAAILRGEVERYSIYLSGGIYEYRVTEPDGKEISSMCGVYGSEAAIESAKEDIDFQEIK